MKALVRASSVTLGPWDMMSPQFRRIGQGLKYPEVCDWANREARVIISNDKGFGKLVFQGRLPNRGVVLLRLRDESAANKVRVVSDLLAGYEGQLLGHFVVASETGVRIRPLPRSF